MSTEILIQRDDTAVITNGNDTIARAGVYGQLVAGNMDPAYYEDARQGRLFHISNSVSGVAPGTALGTAPPLSLHNPLSSGKVLVLWRATVTYVSGTLGAGTIALGYTTQTTAPTSGSAITPVPGLLSAVQGVGKAYTGSTLAGTIAIIKGIISLGAFVNTTAWPGQIAEFDFKGGIIVPEGYAIGLQGIAAAGTSPLVILGLEYAERVS